MLPELGTSRAAGTQRWWGPESPRVRRVEGRGTVDPEEVPGALATASRTAPFPGIPEPHRISEYPVLQTSWESAL